MSDAANLEQTTEPAAPAGGPERACPACNGRSSIAHPAFSVDPWRIVACSDCGFVFLLNPPGYDALVSDFAWEKTRVEEMQRRKTIRPISAPLSKATRWRMGLFGRSAGKIAGIIGNGNVLDVGCGAGGQSYMQTCTPFGIEISQVQHAAADAFMRSRGGYAVHAPAIEGIRQFDDAMFDAVVMYSYLEHEERPMAVLAEVARVLKPGGVAYVRVPNFGSVNRMVTGARWCGFRYPDHVNYFTVPSLRAMAGAAGLGFRLLNKVTIAFDDNVKALLTKTQG